ncbi:MAG: DUF4417 domain-containing protein [Synergistaceae bacterium]|nr:DUF4417 domain-containing protein [Synergistaceae bacterium]
MKIEKKSINELIPAEYNPRKIKKKELEKLKRSIEQFGYIEPIIWNETTGRVVGGHQRLKVLQEQGEQEIECVIVNFSEEEEKAVNIALNRISGEWETDKLFSLLEDLQTHDFDITLTGFDLPDIEDYKIDLKIKDEIGYYGDAREKTFDAYRLNEYDQSRTEGYYQIPTLESCHYIPEEIIGFNYARSTKDKNCGVHFFIDDYQFERIWNSPQKIISRLSDFQCVFTPDFSLYLDMPMAMKIWNIYRSRLVGQMMQDAGLQVIPTLSWAEEETFNFCFDGLGQGGVVAVSTVGVATDEEAKDIWFSGMNCAIERLKPECILCYGSKIDYDFGSTNVKYFESRKFTK